MLGKVRLVKSSLTRVSAGKKVRLVPGIKLIPYGLIAIFVAYQVCTKFRMHWKKSRY